MVISSDRADRYRRIRLLGEGGSGRVWLVEDAARAGQIVALKELAEGSRGREQAIRREFVTLAALEHPNLVRVHEFDIVPETGLGRFSLEYVDGTDLVRCVAAEGSETFLSLAAESLRALAFLHDFGLIHRDLKPANLLVRRQPRSGCRLVMLDFGLVFRGEEPSRDEGPAGTLAYFAPELFDGEPASRRSDLFALGSLFYEAVHGVPPVELDHDDLAGFVTRVRKGDRARRNLPRGYPEGLAVWLEQLIESDPTRRPSTATEALASLNTRCNTRFAIETPATRAARLASGPPPGREAETRRLKESLSPDIGPRLVWLAGGAGTGKTRILRWIGAEMVRDGWEVFTGQAAGSRGFTASGNTLDQLRSSASATRTLVLLDEVETARHEARRFLEQVAREHDKGPLQVIAAIRPAEATHDTLKRLLGDAGQVPTIVRVELGPMESDSLQLMAERVTGGHGIAPQRLQWLNEASEGNPLVAEALLVEGTWETGVAPRRHRGLERSVEKHIERLSPGARAAVEALAVLGRGTSVQEIATVAEIPASLALEGLEETFRSGLAHSEHGRWAPSSRLVVDCVVMSIAQARRRELNRRAAEHTIDSRGEKVDLRLQASLWRRAREPEKSIEWALRSAEQARRAEDFSEAAEWTRFAITQLSRRDPRRRDLRLDHAELLGRCADQPGAVRALATVLWLTTDIAERASVFATRAKMFAVAGRFQRALRDAAMAIESAEASGLPRVLAQGLLARGIALFRLGRYHDAVASLLAASDGYAALNEGASQAEALYVAGMGESRVGRPGAVEYFGEALRLAREIQDHRLEANILIATGIHESDAWRLDRASNCNAEALALAETHKLERAHATALLNMTAVAEDIGRYDQVLELAREAELFALHWGMSSAQVICAVNRADALIHVGRPGEATNLLTGILEREQIGVQPSVLHSARVTLAEALLAADDPPLAKVAALLEKIGSAKDQTPRLRLVCLMLELERRAMPACAEPFGEAWTVYQEAITASPLVLRPDRQVRGQLAHSRALLKEGESKRALAEGGKASRSASEKGLPALAAQAEAVVAEAHQRLGDTEASRRATEQAQRYLDEAANRIEDPEIRRDFLDRPAFRSIRRHRKTATDTGETRLLAIYDMIRGLNTESDPELLLESMLDMALGVVRAERGMILLRDSSQPSRDDEHGSGYTVRLARNLEQETIDEAAEFSRTAVLKAGEGRPVLAMDTGSDDRLSRMTSVTKYGIRSVLCVPLRSRGRIIGAVYLDSRMKGVVFSPEDLRFLEAFADHAALALENAQIRRNLELENQRLQVAAESRTRFGDIVGRCPAMQVVYDLISKVAETTLPVLIQGASGTGKELVARAIHYNSLRSRKPYRTENCAAIPETLLESELFGHVRGAFTGADQDHAGLFEQADGGTLFLDEVGDMPAAMQAKLLRVLEERVVRRVGSAERTPVDVRILTATHRDLSDEVAAGRFREDLFYRLQVMVIQLPPLTERPGDMPLLTEHLLQRIGRERGRPSSPIQPAVIDLLERFHWPGNVRQLENTIQRLILLAGDDPITVPLLESDRELRKMLMEGGAPGATYSLQRNERNQIQQALERAKGNRVRAARLLGISRATIFRKIKQYGLN